MSFLYAWLSPHRPLHEIERGLRSMAETLAELPGGGSDGFCQEGIGLGAKVFENQPESVGERQPIRLEGSGVVVVAVARVDNRSALIDQLPLVEDSRGASDCEIIARSFERWGAACVERLIGDFVFAAWDPRTGDLVVARDPMGARQAYWLSHGDSFAVASRLSCLLATPEVPREIDEHWIAGALQWALLVEDLDRTPVRGVRRLPAGAVLRVDPRGKVRQRTFWRPETKDLRLTDDDAEQGFRELFLEAVRCRMRSSFPIATGLSGGLDSSAVTIAAAQIAVDPERLLAVSATFPSIAKHAPSTDERRYVDAVVRKAGIAAVTVRADELSPLSHRDEIERALEAPNVSPNAYINAALYAAASEAGCRTLLTGVDGDSVVGHGLDALPYYLRRMRWRRLHAELEGLRTHNPRYRASLGTLLWGGAVKPQLRRWLPAWLHRARARLRGRVRWFPAPVFSASLDRRARIRERMIDLNRPTALGAANWYGLQGVLQSLQWHHALGQRWGIEPAHPFQDRRLVEFCLRLPPDQRLRNGRTRSILRRSLADLLPVEVAARLDKGTLGASGQWTLARDHAELLESLQGLPPALDGYVDPAGGVAALEEYLAAPRARGSQAAYAAVFCCLTLAEWLQADPLGLRPDGRRPTAG